MPEPLKKNWTINIDHASKNQFKKFRSNHPREHDACFRNLDRVLKVLETSKVGTFQIGFLGSEGEGVYRIAQTGVPSAKESRLYVHFDTGNCVVYVLGIGTKETQSADIQDSKTAVKKIRET